MTKYFLMLMQDEVKRVKLVGLMPSNFNADDGRSYPGFRFYCTEENENAYGITTRSLLMILLLFLSSSHKSSILTHNLSVPILCVILLRRLKNSLLLSFLHLRAVVLLFLLLRFHLIHLLPRMLLRL